mmetsp:Transcript_72599/g.160335  ORF Transcript_72599/g.160335 Transcript_72599/m.160335 type:complete len:119 (-) Transcript_72599:2070-2426(-)
MTTILSAPMTVDKRWAIRTTEQLPWTEWTKSSRARCTFPSFSASRAEVASSSRSSLGPRRSARAMATRCRWPPLSRVPPSPIIDWYFSSNFWMKSFALAASAAFSTSACCGTSPGSRP